MGEMRVLSVEVDAATAEMIDGLVREGRFADEREILRYSLLLLGDWLREDEESWTDMVEFHGIDRIRELVEEGLNSGEPIPGNFDAEDIKRRGRERLARKRAA